MLSSRSPHLRRQPTSRRALTQGPAGPIAVVYDWSGFYIGANGGWGSSHKCWDFDTPAGVFMSAAEGCHDATGGSVGGQIGYRWQASSWVFGLEAQGDWADFNGSMSACLSRLRTHSKVDAFGLFTGQVGYAGNNVLFYIKGGAAVTSDRYSISMTGTGAGGLAAGTTRWGGVVGAGVEFGFAPNWSVGIEYNRLFMRRPHLASSRQPRVAFGNNRQSPGRGSRHRARQLPLGRSGDREVLIAATASQYEKAGLAPAFYLVASGFCASSEGATFCPSVARGLQPGATRRLYRRFN